MDNQVGGAARSGQAVKDSAMIAALNASGFVSALLVDIVIAARFGLGRETDAFFIAFTIPQLIASILSITFNVVLVPIFTRVIIAEEKPGLWRISSNLANLSLMGMGALGVVGSLSAPLLIRVFGAGLDHPTRLLATSLAELTFLMVIPLGTVEVFKATLNSLLRFAFPAATMLIRNVAVLLVVLLYSSSLGIRSLAFGYVIASWFQLASLAGVLLLSGFRYHLIFQWREPRVVEVLRQIRYPLAGAGLGQANILLERFLASFLPSGLVSALSYARRVLRATDSIFVTSISTALLPDLSAKFAHSNLQAFKRSLSLGIKLLVFVSVPVTVAIIALSVPIVRTLFQHGAFDQAMTQITARLLSLYILGLPAMALVQLLIIAYYASLDTTTPFYILSGMLVLNITLGLTLFFALNAEGLALALSLARIISCVVAMWLLHGRVGTSASGLIRFSLKVGLAAVVMGLLVSSLHGTALGQLGDGIVLGRALYLGISVAIGTVVYTGIALLLLLREGGPTTQAIKTRLKAAQFRKMLK
ncbi:MAG: murein biosynthesis integral membrane protein MurJ [Dehalococcoidia bacterium]|nr:murein biosynthesis integral membrane protein MurJ [Dehalococcoidia bacterium]